MRITVTRTGGFAGITRRARLDSAGRPDADRLEELARAALSEGADARPTGVPDGFQYGIEVDGTTVYCADPRLSRAQRELITTVLREGA
ncbi:protealysin inhibitor emfourin [Streptomyces sp. NPDC057702]|uniref:protealysin inhibitor emfourin n=1 Tax=unclassified Streptomyces TaxID=2593676 RepID=UPI0036838F74